MSWPPYVVPASTTLAGMFLPTPFADAQANASTAAGGAILAAHTFRYMFTITNTHQTQFLYLCASDGNGSATRYIDIIAPGETGRYPGFGNTNLFFLLGSGANTTYILGGY